MDDANQFDIPPSFIALYLSPGRLKPSAPRAAIAARYENCEDLANHLVDYAQAQRHDLGIDESDVLQRCHAGLLSAASGMDAAEAGWVIRRLAELAGWADPGELSRTGNA